MRAAFEGIVDYAGLFPPAACGMGEAVRQYDHYRRSPDRWLLGRFVVAAAHLDEFAVAVGQADLTFDPADPWLLSAVASQDVGGDVARIVAWNATHAKRGYRVDAIEHRVATVDDVSAATRAIDGRFAVFLEVPPQGPYGALVDAIAGGGALAKVRTGGVTPPQFPSSAALAEFLHAVTARGLRFKATAGLHHPFRGEFPLTYEPGSATWSMFGFVNLLLATADLRRHADPAIAQAILDEADPEAIRHDDDGIAWRDRHYATAELVATREASFTGFGSCSFIEPLEGLRAGALA